MHALITCPSVRGLVHFQTLVSVVSMRMVLDPAKITSEFAVTPFSEIIDARNLAATRVAEGAADILIGMDDDVGVTQEAFVQMINADVPYIGACCPQRLLDMHRLAEGVRQGYSNRDAIRFAAPLVGGPGTAAGISEVEKIGGGFFILRAEPLKEMVRSGVAAKTTARLPGGGVADAYGFYDCLYDEEGGRMSEDISFCLRLRQAGFPVHAYKGPGLSHSGEMTFHS